MQLKPYFKPNSPANCAVRLPPGHFHGHCPPVDAGTLGLASQPTGRAHATPSTAGRRPGLEGSRRGGRSPGKAGVGSLPGCPLILVVERHTQVGLERRTRRPRESRLSRQRGQPSADWRSCRTRGISRKVGLARWRPALSGGAVGRDFLSVRVCFGLGCAAQAHFAEDRGGPGVCTA